jgi:hypothetical protein
MTVRVDDALRQAFLKASAAKGLSAAENIRQFMEHEVQDYERRQGEHAPEATDSEPPADQ